MTDSVDIRLVLGTLWKRKWWIFACVVICVVLAIAAAFAISPVYRGFVVLVPANMNSQAGALNSALGQFSGLASLAGVNLNSGISETPEAISVLTSRQFTERFINENNLMPVLYAQKWDSINKRWKVPANKVPSAQRAFEFFDKTRSVIQDRKTGLVTLQVDWKDPNQAANWANDLVSRLNAEMRSRAIARADASVGYLEKELKTTSEVAVQQAISRLMESEIQRKMLANVSQEYAFRIIDRAIAPDADAPLFPHKSLFAIMGVVVGLIISFLWLLMTGVFSDAKTLGEKIQYTGAQG